MRSFIRLANYCSASCVDRTPFRDGCKSERQPFQAHSRFQRSQRLMVQRLKSWLIAGVTVFVLLLTLMPAIAQESSPTGNQIDGYPVVLDGKTLFRIQQGIPGVATAEERAHLISQRLVAIAGNNSIAPDEIRVDDQEGGSVVRAGDTVLFTVRDADKGADQSRQATAATAVQQVREAVSRYREERKFERIVQGILYAILSTIILIGFLIALQRFSSRLLTRLRVARQTDALDLKIQNFQLLGSNSTSYLLSGIIRLVRLTLFLVSLYIYIPFVLSQFPATKPIGDSILSDIVYQAGTLVAAFAQYLPNLAVILIIVFLTHYTIEFAKLVIAELGRDDAYPWFYPEWVEPTTRLATFLIVAIACVIIAPYLPGFQSPAFQGVSLFLGALVTLGSSSAVANAIAGFILVYTRAFRIGDIIKIGDVTGEFIEKTLFVTRLLTFKKEVITIPNASVLSSNVTNYNAILREAGGYLLMHTTITLGYDAPWRQVHEVLIQAAQATSGVVTTPRPFVLQTSLNDFHVSYEVNAYSDRPDLMPGIYSELHQNIQDYCNQAGIEILSPGFSAIRDGNHSTIPAEYLGKDYTAPGFRLDLPATKLRSESKSAHSRSASERSD